MNNNLHKILKVELTLYAPFISIVYICILAFSIDIHDTLTHQTYLLYASTVPIMLLLSRTLGMCPYHKLSIINPLIAPVCMLVTPDNWDRWIRLSGIILTVVVIALMTIRFIKNQRRESRQPSPPVSSSCNPGTWETGCRRSS